MRFVFLVLLLFATTQLFAQTKTATIQYHTPFFSDAARVENIRKALPVIDKLYKDYAVRIHSPGFVYGLIVDGQLIGTGETGITQTENKQPATTRSVFRIASMSKSFTALAILQLRDAGKLQLDDPVTKYIPAFAKQAFPATDAPPVTIRHLLTHAAGFPEDNPWGDRQLAKTEAELLALINRGISYSNVPGVAYEYSNLGFALLGHIIKKVSGRYYANYITANILKPLGMNHTYFEYTRVPKEVLAHGYRWLNEDWTEQPLLHDGVWGAMGGMMTTIEDFSKYMALHQSAWPPRSEKENGVLKRSSLREMHQPWNFNNLNTNYTYPSGRACPTALAYGYGLRWTKDCQGRVAVGHSGGLPGFGSNWQILPEYGIGIVCFSNVTYAPTTAINTQVLDTLVALANLKPRQGKASSVLVQRQQQLVQLLPHWNGAEASGLFAENFFLDYFTDSLRKEATAIFEKAGKILQVREIMPENGLRGSFIIDGEKKNIEVRFTLTPEAVPLIQEYQIREKGK
jgi:CubicO group peptidase (beta-lactamase class C family)